MAGLSKASGEKEPNKAYLNSLERNLLDDVKKYLAITEEFYQAQKGDFDKNFRT
ncbi:hypothetical protein SBF1_4290012 [Candidatus Desulfosporosinus infrequens]|uniref:Uncharacterized protein n=1 Tax=Candidatus Desulfosporosinus infrequens TaxID=2043169 RepID=A0A2U3LAU5_9FIRM|nr:hypothetical protein SBF1_4290012 [Candidatus Desulfosporosinus infrequens]